MCPLCIGSALYLLGGAGSAGGAAALALRSLTRRGHHAQDEPGRSLRPDAESMPVHPCLPHPAHSLDNGIKETARQRDPA